MLVLLYLIMVAFIVGSLYYKGVQSTFYYYLILTLSVDEDCNRLGKNKQVTKPNNCKLSTDLTYFKNPYAVNPSSLNMSER